LLGIILTAFLTFVPFCNTFRDAVVNERRRATEDAVRRQELGRADDEKVKW